MAYNNGFPMYYPQYQQAAPQQNSGAITWVQGEAAARSYMVGAGQSVMLMDSDESVFYIKSADQSGMPLPLRIFDYKERVMQSQVQTEPPQIQQTMSAPDYITREEFERRIAEITSPSVPKKTTAIRKEKAEP